MKKKIPLIIVGIWIIFIGVGVCYYLNHFTNTAILKNITNREGYSLNIRDFHNERKHSIKIRMDYVTTELTDKDVEWAIMILLI